MPPSTPSTPRNTVAIPIPISKRPDAAGRTGAASSSRSESRYAATPSSASSSSGSSGPSSLRYGSFQSAAESSSPAASRGWRRESLMSASFSRADYTVINVGEEERPRLITCIKASQGFDWNQEIFLPSYAEYHFDDLERRQDPVEDIFVSDEEVRNMFPA